jgi:hypothetical protein
MGSVLSTGAYVLQDKPRPFSENAPAAISIQRLRDLRKRDVED